MLACWQESCLSLVLCKDTVKESTLKCILGLPPLSLCGYYVVNTQYLYNNHGVEVGIGMFDVG